MSESIQTVALPYIHEQWMALRGAARPAGFWIRQYEVLKPDDSTLPAGAIPLAAWYMDRQGIHARPIESWQRFEMVQLLRPWNQGSATLPPNPTFGRTFELGIAGFAAYEAAAQIYVEYVWGNLHGRGEKLLLGDDTSIIQRESLWIM